MSMAGCAAFSAVALTDSVGLCCTHCTAHRDKVHDTAKVIQSQVRGLHWTVDYATTATRIFIVRSVLDVSMPWFVRVRVRTELSVGGLPSLPVPVIALAVQTSSRPTGGSSSHPVVRPGSSSEAIVMPSPMLRPVPQTTKAGAASAQGGGSAHPDAKNRQR